MLQRDLGLFDVPEHAGIVSQSACFGFASVGEFIGRPDLALHVGEATRTIGPFFPKACDGRVS